MRTVAGRTSLGVALVALLVASAPGCALLRREPRGKLPPITLIAVLPVERAEALPQPKVVDVELGSARLAAEA